MSESGSLVMPIKPRQHWSISSLDTDPAHVVIEPALERKRDMIGNALPAFFPGLTAKVLLFAG